MHWAPDSYGSDLSEIGWTVQSRQAALQARYAKAKPKEKPAPQAPAAPAAPAPKKKTEATNAKGERVLGFEDGSNVTVHGDGTATHTKADGTKVKGTYKDPGTAGGAKPKAAPKRAKVKKAPSADAVTRRDAIAKQRQAALDSGEADDTAAADSPQGRRFRQLDDELSKAEQEVAAGAKKATPKPKAKPKFAKPKAKPRPLPRVVGRRGPTVQQAHGAREAALQEFNKCHDPETGEFCSYPNPDPQSPAYRPLTRSEEDDIMEGHPGEQGKEYVRRINAGRALAFERATVRYRISQVKPSGHPVGQHWFTKAEKVKLLLRRMRMGLGSLKRPREPGILPAT